MSHFVKLAPKLSGNELRDRVNELMDLTKG